MDIIIGRYRRDSLPNQIGSFFHVQARESMTFVSILGF